MAVLKETTIEGDFLAEDTIIDLNEAIGGVQDPDNWFSGSTGIYGGIRIDRGSETAALAAWNEDQDYWEVGIEGSTERVLTESDKDSIVADVNLEEGTNINLSTNASTGATIVDAVASGSGGEVQFNDGGLFAADSDFTFDTSTNRLAAAGGLDIANESTVRIGGQDALYLDWNSGNEGLAVGPSAEDHVRTSSDIGNIFIRAEDGGGSYNLTSSGNVVIGDLTTTSIGTDHHVVIGYRAAQNVSFSTGPESVSVGYDAGRGANDLNKTTFIGAHAGQGASGSNANRESVGVGHNALRGSSPERVTAVGYNTGRDSSGIENAVFIGHRSGQSSGDYTQASVTGGVAVGIDSFTTSAGQFVVGAPADKGSTNGTISDAYLGKGVEATDPTEITVHGTNAQIIDGSKNASKAGADITVATGKGSGDAAGASFRVKTAEPETMDYTEQSLSERIRVNASGFYITQAPSTTTDADEVLSRDQSTGLVEAISPADLKTGKTYTAATTGDETQTATFSGSSPTYDSGTAVNFSFHVVAQVSSITSASLTNASEGDAHTWEIEGSAVNRSGSLQLIGEPDVNSVSYDVPVNGLEVSLNTSGSELQIKVTGIPETTVEWAAEGRDTEIDLV